MRRGELLTQISLFEGLSSAEAEDLGTQLSEHRLAAHEVLFSLGDPGASMYVVVSGAVQIFLPASGTGARVVVKEARSGEYFGELSLFDDKPRSASVEASVDTVLLELRREVFAHYLERVPRAALAVLAEMAERLRETNTLLSQRAAKDVVKEIEENLTWGQRLADRVADLNGSWAFISFLLLLTVGWGIANKLLPRPFDDYPFTFFNLLLAVLVALQGPLIVMSQNRQTLKDRAQAETDFRVNLKNEVNIETMQAELGAFRADTGRRLEGLERTLQLLRNSHESPQKSRTDLRAPAAIE
jgi:CRP/FNR family transcriptional regulator, cyclic AMP receptor protein